MLNFTFNKMVPKLMEVLEDPDKAEKTLEVDLMMALSLMVAKVLLFIHFQFFSQKIKNK